MSTDKQKLEWRKRAKDHYMNTSKEGRQARNKYQNHLQRNRAAIKSRDNNECQLCGSKTELQPHHILPRNQFPEKACDNDNIITLCKTCHKTKAHPKGCLKEYDSKIAEQLMAKIEQQLVNTEEK